jgi:hypothetical protein
MERERNGRRRKEIVGTQHLQETNGLWTASLTISRFDTGLHEIFPIFSYDPGKIYGSH